MVLFLKFAIFISVGTTVAGLVLVYLRRFHNVVSFCLLQKSSILAKYIKKRRLRKIEGQLVDAVDMLANGLKAGLSLQQTFQMTSQDAPSPISGEFALIIDQVKVGKSFEDALVELSERAPLDDIKILVESILVLRQTGGNLVETFASIAQTIRGRQKVSGKIKVLTAQGTIQAVVILILPFALGLGLYFVAPWFIEPLVSTPLGWGLIAFALCLQTLGGMWLKKIVTIKV